MFWNGALTTVAADGDGEAQFTVLKDGWTRAVATGMERRMQTGGSSHSRIYICAW